MTITKGHCLCGAVTYEFEGEAKWCGHCHCESCRRTTASPFTTFVGVPKEAVRFTGADLKIFESSPGVERSFCDHCGTPICYEGERWPDEVHFYAATLEHPERVHPRFHVNCDEQLPWVHLDDGLPRHGGSVK